LHLLPIASVGGATHLENVSMLEKPFQVARGFAHRFPEGNDPFQMMTRLLEECGELAQQVNHFEGSGVKRQKHGEPDRARLAKEVQQVVGAALALAVHYGVEREVEQAFQWVYGRLCREGHIDPPHGEES
jgi:NTP pyrophosphatase (non-canonical NTP hydrolase)